MKSSWNKINKAFGIVNLIVGLICFYVIFDFAQKQVDHIKYLSEQYGFSKSDTTFLDLVLSNRVLLIVGILSTASGILILLRRELGWILGYSNLLISILILIPITLFGTQDVTTTIIGPEFWVQIYSGVGLLISLCLLILLSTKPIRILNGINRNSWLLSFGIVFLLYLTGRIL